MRKYVFLSVLMLLLTGSCGDSSKSRLTDAEEERIALAKDIALSEAAGELVLVVGGETITSDEIITSPAELNMRFVSPIERFRPIAQSSELEQFKDRARGQLEGILTATISDILLYQHARRQAGKNMEEAFEKEAEKQLRKFVLALGADQAKIDEALEGAGTDREGYKERRKRAMLVQWYVASKLPIYRPVTYRELMDCYNEIKDGFFARPASITFRLIDIRPARLEVVDPNQDRRQLAEELAHKLLARIEAGEDFGELAKQYSHGHMGAFGGLWKPVQPGSLAPPYDMLAAQAEKTEPGQIAELVITAEHIFIMKLEEKQLLGYEPFEKVQRQVEAKVNSDRRNEVVDRLKAKLIEQAEVGETDEFIDFCLEKIYRMSNE